ncbi:NAD-dependent epimerase/dehydratase family protein, partial [Streptomyces sp. gb1(2016)]
MRVFVTGASGWIGSAVVPDLIGAGHEVVEASTDHRDAGLGQGVGGGIRTGESDDLDVLRSASASADGVIHLAFNHELAFEGGDFKGAADADRRAVEAMGEALACSGKPFVLASGTPAQPGRAATERDGHEIAPGAADNSALAGPAARMATA